MENWALWHERMQSGGLGYATRSSFLADPVDRDVQEARLPVDEVEAGITDEAVRGLRVTHEHLHRTIELIYLTGCGVREASRRTGRAESTVHAQLSQADVVLSGWFAERKRLKAEQAQMLQQQLRAARPARLEAAELPPVDRRMTIRRIREKSFTE